MTAVYLDLLANPEYQGHLGLQVDREETKESLEKQENEVNQVKMEILDPLDSLVPKESQVDQVSQAEMEREVIKVTVDSLDLLVWWWGASRQARLEPRESLGSPGRLGGRETEDPQVSQVLLVNLDSQV